MINRMLRRLDEGTCNFTAVAAIRRELEAAGFTALNENDHWTLCRGARHYVVKNDSAIFAFIVGQKPAADGGFHIISAHSDSPCFKLKPNPEIIGDNGLVSLNVEKYGGGILYTWFDRPLSIAGRVMTRSDDPLRPVTHIIDLKAPVATIPHLAIHFNRSVNEGNPLSVQKDMKPVVGWFTADKLKHYEKRGGVIRSLVADHLGIEPEHIVSSELCLYPLEAAGILGVDGQMMQSARIDDLQMAFCAMEALLQSADKPGDATRIMAIFDNEETGSGTKQGAHSPVLAHIMQRIAMCTPDAGKSDDTSKGNACKHDDAFLRSLAKTFMISADDAHAWHPNYNEKYDPTNHPVLGGGPVIKINANCKYMTDAFGDAVFATLCEDAGVNCQYFVNHSDVAGGSTLGNILTGQLDIPGVDMGCAIWAMHSARETAAVSDVEATIRVFSFFYGL
ncbi:MAG: M18 family aminopeptidase [Muribaculum sp.]|nr:M18 family aminopeptidase [Muribaculum sp.]